MKDPVNMKTEKTYYCTICQGYAGYKPVPNIAPQPTRMCRCPKCAKVTLCELLPSRGRQHVKMERVYTVSKRTNA